MRIQKWVFCFGLLVAFAAFFSNAAHADLYWETENVSTGMPHQPSGTTIHKNYFTSSAFRTEMGDGKVVIIDYDSMKLYSLNPQTKTYTEVNIKEMDMPAKMSAAQQEQMGKMLGAMGMQVTPTAETMTISGYKCTKYMVEIAMVHGEYWVSKEVKGYRELKEAGAKIGAAVQNNPMFRQMNFAGMVEKLDGFPVQTTNQIMGGTVVSTLKKIEQKRLDPELFQVPADYTLKTK